MTTGIVILDNNCFDYLADPQALKRFRANLRAADWIPQISELNVLEATATSNSRKREQLLSVIREVGGSGSVLPWPFRMLKEMGQSIVAGRSIHRVENVDLHGYLYNREEAATIREEAAQFNRAVEDAFIRLHERGRPKLRKRMREKGITDIYGSPRKFLAEGWADSDTRKMFAEETWSRFGLPGPPLMEALELCEPWKLLLDAEGFAMYERGIVAQQPKRVGRLDLIQLTYLGIAERRMVTTADEGLLRAANAILPGRYRNARGVHIADLIS